MRYRIGYACGAVVLAAVALTVHAGCTRKPNALRHVILISMDTTRADRLGCYGSQVSTPNIDRVAVAGVRFDQVLSPAPTTLAAHTAIMTGTYPHTHGVPRNGFSLDPENAMLAEVLRERGYRTAAFLGSFALSSDFGFNAGFDHFDEDFDVHIQAQVTDQEQRRAETVTDRVLEYLDGAGRGDDPLFLFVHYFDPHSPYDPPAPYDTLYHPRDQVKRATFSLVNGIAARHRRQLGFGGAIHLNMVGLKPGLIHAADGVPIRAERELAALYAGEITYMDSHIGRLIDGLESRGILDDALVIITSDHGETHWEHADFWNHGMWVYDTTARVPIIVYLPGGDVAPKVVDTPVSTVDLMPTILELAGIEAPARVEGVSLVPALRGEPFERGPVYCEATQPWNDPSPDAPWPNATNPRCIRAGNWKYILAPYLDDFEEMYDLDADPDERVDVLRWNRARSAGVRDELRARLDEWSAGANPLPLHSGTLESEALRKKLEALGYIGGASVADDVETPTDSSIVEDGE